MLWHQTSSHTACRLRRQCPCHAQQHGCTASPLASRWAPPSRRSPASTKQDTRRAHQAAGDRLRALLLTLGTVWAAGHCWHAMLCWARCADPQQRGRGSLNRLHTQSALWLLATQRLHGWRIPLCKGNAGSGWSVRCSRAIVVLGATSHANAAQNDFELLQTCSVCVLVPAALWWPLWRANLPTGHDVAVVMPF